MQDWSKIDGVRQKTPGKRRKGVDAHPDYLFIPLDLYKAAGRSLIGPIQVYGKAKRLK